RRERVQQRRLADPRVAADEHRAAMPRPHAVEELVQPVQLGVPAQHVLTKLRPPPAAIKMGAMRPPVPPFTEETARQKVQAAEDAWNTGDPERVAGAYTEDSQWRNRDEFLTGREEIVAFLRRKWDRELDYALRKDLWTFAGNRIAVRFQYEWHDADGQWWRSYGNENWEFEDNGLMQR